MRTVAVFVGAFELVANLPCGLSRQYAPNSPISNNGSRDDDSALPVSNQSFGSLSNAREGVAFSSPHEVFDAFPGFIGVTYSPEHLKEWPLAGGWPNKRQLEAAINEDFRLLSCYVTRIRTTAAQYYGVDVAPIAARYGLRVHLTVALWPTIFAAAETKAAIRGLQQVPETIEAIAVGEQRDFEDPTGRLCETINEIKRHANPKGVLFGTYFADISKRRCSESQVVADAVDFFGIFIIGDGVLDADALNRNYWNSDKPPLKVLMLEFAVWSDRKALEADMMRTVVKGLDVLRTWTPHGGGNAVVFLGRAFDLLEMRISGSPLSTSHFRFQRIGLFTPDRKRKVPRFPRPLRAENDPAQLPHPPSDPNCPAGMYQMTLGRLNHAVIACHISGYNFHRPTNFDERLLAATCGNPYCQVVVNALKSIPSLPPCPFDYQVTEKTLHEMILKPVVEFCPFLPTRTSESFKVVATDPFQYDLGRIPLDCRLLRGWFLFLVHDGDGRERCQARTGFDGSPLNQTILEKMCREPSCEVVMQQYANPFRWIHCTESPHWLEKTILRPYFDGCYEDSQLAASYFDVAYRPRRAQPRLPGSEPHTESAQPSPQPPYLIDADAHTTEQPTDQKLARPTESESPVASSIPSLDRNPTLNVLPHKSSKLVVVASVSVSAIIAVLLLAALFRHIKKRYSPAHIVRTRDCWYQDLSDDTMAESLEAKQHLPVWADTTLASLFVKPEQLYDVRMIGSGAQALVYLVLYQPDSKKTSRDIVASIENGAVCLAAKRLTRASINANPDAVNNFVAEIKLVASLRHPNIVSLVGVSWTTGTDIQALFELMPDGDLCAYLSSTPRYEWTATKFRLALDVIEALAYAHSRCPVVVHRDIKSRNVLLTPFFPVTASDHNIAETNNAAANHRLGAKLTDFGVSRHLSKHATMTTGVGTSRWLAPEVILGGGDYDESSDVYSFGVLLSELDTHALPFVERRTPTGDLLPDIALLQMVAMEGVTPAFMGSSPVALVALAHECLSYDPTKRPTARVVARRLHALHEASQGVNCATDPSSPHQSHFRW